MFVPESGKDLHLCSCGCNREVSRSTVWRSPPIEQLESPPPPKRSHITHFQVGQESFVIQPGKQKQSRTDNNFSTSHPRADTSSSSSEHPQSSISQLHAPLFEFNPSLPGSPQASNLPQSSEDARSEASGLLVDDVLLDLHAQTHQTADQNHDEDYGDTLKGDAVEVADPVDH